MTLESLSVECMHSRDQQPCKFISAKESVHIRKEWNSHRIGLVNQHGRRFIVLETSMAVMTSCAYALHVTSIRSSRDQQPRNFIETKQSVYIRKELNSYRMGLLHHRGCRFIFFGKPIWLPWRQVHTLFCTPLQHQNKWVYSFDSSGNESKQKAKLNRLPLKALTKTHGTL